MDEDILFFLAQETQFNRIENYITYDNNGNLSDEYYYYEDDIADFFLRN